VDAMSSTCCMRLPTNKVYSDLACLVYPTSSPISSARQQVMLARCESGKHLFIFYCMIIGAVHVAAWTEIADVVNGKSTVPLIWIGMIE